MQIEEWIIHQTLSKINHAPYLVVNELSLLLRTALFIKSHLSRESEENWVNFLPVTVRSRKQRYNSPVRSSISTARILIWLPKICYKNYTCINNEFLDVYKLRNCYRNEKSKILAVGKPASSVLLIITIRELNEIQHIRLVSQTLHLLTCTTMTSSNKYGANGLDLQTNFIVFPSDWFSCTFW